MKESLTLPGPRAIGPADRGAARNMEFNARCKFMASRAFPMLVSGENKIPGESGKLITHQHNGVQVL